MKLLKYISLDKLSDSSVVGYIVPDIDIKGRFHNYFSHYDSIIIDEPKTIQLITGIIDINESDIYTSHIVILNKRLYEVKFGELDFENSNIPIIGKYSITTFYLEPFGFNGRKLLLTYDNFKKSDVRIVGHLYF